MVRHFLDVEGAATLPTESLLMVERAVSDLIRVQAMGTVHGPAGLGKTYAVEQTLARAVVDGRAGRAPCWVKFPSRPTMRLVAAALLAELTRVPTGRGNRFVLTEQLVEELAPPPGGAGHVVVVDEAQSLNTECIEYLRYLHDHRATRFALLLVGGDGTWKVLSREPMLRSRIYRRVSVEPLTPAEVCRLIPTYHPLYHGVDAELLLLIDDHFAHGNLRHWAAFTKTAAALCAAANSERVDEAVARNAFTLHGGGVSA